MPRRNDPEAARCIQVSITIRPRDLMEWRTEADRLGVSLSRAIWLRAVAGRPRTVDRQFAIARELGRLGNNLNQAVAMMWRDGATEGAASVEATIRACEAIKHCLTEINFDGSDDDCRPA